MINRSIVRRVLLGAATVMALACHRRLAVQKVAVIAHPGGHRAVIRSVDGRARCLRP